MARVIRAQDNDKCGEAKDPTGPQIPSPETHPIRYSIFVIYSLAFVGLTCYPLIIFVVVVVFFFFFSFLKSP